MSKNNEIAISNEVEKQIKEMEVNEVFFSRTEQIEIFKSLKIEYVDGGPGEPPVPTIKSVVDWERISNVIIDHMDLMVYGNEKVFVYKNQKGKYVIADGDLGRYIRSVITKAVVGIPPQITTNLSQAIMDRAPSHNPKLNPTYIYYSNGYFDTVSGKFHKETAPTYNHRRINWPYLDNAEILSKHKKSYDMYNDFLKTISQGDPEIMRQIQQMIGASLLPTKQFRKAFFMIGEGGNGKSSLINLINRVHGTSKISSIALENLSGQRAQFNSYGLVLKTANLIDDLSNISMKENGVLKTIISGDQLTAEIKGGKQFSFYNEATLIAAGNSIPNINDKGASTAILDRIIFIPLRHKYKVSADGIEKARELLEDDVINVVASIVATAVHAAKKAGTLEVGAKSIEVSERFETETDSVKYWLENDPYMEDELVTVKYVTVDDAYKKYKNHIIDSGQHPLGKIKFKETLFKHLPELDKKQKRLADGTKQYVFELKTKEVSDLPFENLDF